MSWNIELKAKEYAKEYYINEVKEKAFIEGVLWTIISLTRIVEVHPMEGDAGGYCDKLRLKDVNQFISEAKKHINTPPNKEERL